MTQPGTELPPLPLASSWYVGINQQACGPYDFPTLRSMVGTGQLTPMSMVFKVGENSWLVAGQVADLACIFEVTPPLLSHPCRDRVAQTKSRRKLCKRLR